MPQVVRFEAPYQVGVTEVPPDDLQPGQVRVRTLFSGISAGTELTAYHGTNPYLTRQWDPVAKLFGDRDGTSDLGYPLEGWGYSEVGRVVETGPDLTAPHVGDVVWGIWGHRSETCIDGALAARQVLPPGVAPEVGCFARVGSVALNAVLAAECGIGSTVVVLGLGVIGLLATAFATRTGASVIGVDGIESRRAQALRYGAREVFAPADDVAGHVRKLTGNLGADVVIELSGSYAALHRATRIAGPEAQVIAAGFYQGPATDLRLGEEFHHNRVTIVPSQIGAVPARLQPRWTRERLTATVMAELAAGRPDVLELVTCRFPVDAVGAAFELLDGHPADTLQVLLEFPDAAT
jgi:2-desacetyl-2-hydroxyethyl bacteriochlorophyllide A dehydrogenase